MLFSSDAKRNMEGEEVSGQVPARQPLCLWTSRDIVEMMGRWGPAF